jgi:Gram-negative bacterial TonB protein C-terminal
LKRACWFLSLALLMGAPWLRGQDRAKLTERLHAADVASALDVRDMPPWHLKMTVQLFDAKGKPTNEGTIEEWWSSPDNDRREYKTTTYTATEIRTGGHLYRTQGTPTPPYYLDLLRKEAVHPMPSLEDPKAMTPELKKRAIGKATLDCVDLKGYDSSVCFDPGQDRLRASFELGVISVIRNSMGKFAGKEVSLDVSVGAQGVQAASSHIVVLKTEAISDDRFAHSGDIVLHETAENIGSESVAHQLKPDKQIHGSHQVYAKGTDGQSIGGTAILQATIGADEHVHDLRLVSASAPQLGAAAMAVVQQWIYEPCTLDGTPVETDTIITINVTLDQ